MQTAQMTTQQKAAVVGEPSSGPHVLQQQDEAVGEVAAAGRGSSSSSCFAGVDVEVGAGTGMGSSFQQRQLDQGQQRSRSDRSKPARVGPQTGGDEEPDSRCGLITSDGVSRQFYRFRIVLCVAVVGIIGVYVGSHVLCLREVEDLVQSHRKENVPDAASSATNGSDGPAANPETVVTANVEQSAPATLQMGNVRGCVAAICILGVCVGGGAMWSLRTDDHSVVPNDVSLAQGTSMVLSVDENDSER